MIKRGNPEGQIQLQIIHVCKAKGWTIGKIKNKGSRVGNRFIFDPYAFLGLPDLLLFANNKLYFIECKAIDGKQSPMQESFQEFCERSNTPYILARSIEDVLKIVEEKT